MTEFKFYEHNLDEEDRFSLCSLGFQPLEAKAIEDKLDCLPKLRYAEEFHRDITNAAQFETAYITKYLSKHGDNNHNDISIQNIYPTSNGRSKQYLYTECGINPNDKLNVNKLRGHLLSKSISDMILIKQKQEIDAKLSKFKLVHKKCNDKINKDKQKEFELMEKARNKSLEIARKLGFVPQFLHKTEHDKNSDDEYDHEDGEIKEKNTNVSNPSKLKSESAKDNHKTMTAPMVNTKEIERAKQLLNTQKGIIPSAPLIMNGSNVSSKFECKSVLKSDGSEYDKVLGSKLHGIRKYDNNFRPMFPITNNDYKFSVVSDYGLKLLQKYGYKEGEGLGRNKQGVTTFPRLIGQNTFKGINYGDRNRKNLSIGFIHCIACEKSFCGYSNLQNHILCKKHKKNLSIKPNNFVLLCVQCQLQFPTCQKIKEHYMLVQHDDTVPGISTFNKQLRDELRRNQIKYIQNMKTTPNPYRNIVNTPSPPSSPKLRDNDDNKDEIAMESKQIEMEQEKNMNSSLSVPTPLPYTKQGLPPMPHQIPPPPSHLGYHHHLFPSPSAPNLPSYPHPSHPSHPHGLPPMWTRQERLSPIDVPISQELSEEIKTKIYRLGIKLPIAVPNIAWIYCPVCKSFFTTFSKLNTHYNSQRHIVLMNGLNQEMKNKMYQLFEFIQLKQTEHLTKVTK